MWTRPAFGPAFAPGARRFAPRRIACTAAVGLAGLALSACGGASGGNGQVRAAPDYQRALAQLYGRADELLPGGDQAFQRRLTDLRGYPVVVNKWASWCGPCREEFPWFQDLSARLGKRIAFLGVNSNDSSAAARTFLEEYPVPYPSYSDPGQDIARAIKATTGFPGTAFYDRTGKLVYARQGQYPSQAALAADIKRYAR